MSVSASVLLTGTLDQIVEASLDRHAQRLQRVSEPLGPMRLMMLRSAVPSDWRRVVDALAPFMKDRRLGRLTNALHRRRSGLHLVIENIADPFNLASVLRTAEALGIQHVHVIESVSLFALPASEAQSASRGALGRNDGGEGASRWLTIHRYASTQEALETLRARRLRIFASDCPTAEDDSAEEPIGGGVATNEVEAEGKGWLTAKRGGPSHAVPIGELDFAHGAGADDGSHGVALVFGNERRGVSRMMLDGADGAFYLPMSGFTQSFNISVALAMALAAAVATGRFPTDSLAEDERIEILGRWLLRDIKAARSLLYQAGLEFADF